MSYDLCLLEPAKRPYYIETIRTEIYSLEELCFYLYHNIYLIDETIMNERLCDWLRDELHLTKLYRQLYEQLEKKSGAGFFVLPIFREAGYLTQQQIREFQERLSRLEVQSADMKQKLRADYLVKERMYTRAIWEYRQILARRNPGKLGISFYAVIWNNLGAAYAGLFAFREAADCFFEAYSLGKTKDALRKYVSALPLFLNEQEYEEKLKELRSDRELISEIQKYNAKLCKSREFEERWNCVKKKETSELVKELREEYCRSTKM